MTYGVTSQGYVRKPLAKILSDIEARLATEFGSEFIQTPQSPAGQINGLFAELVAEIDEGLLDLYQSYNPAEAEGVRLDILGKIVGVERGLRDDDSYRIAIIKAGAQSPIICDLVNALYAIEGVTYANVYENLTSAIDLNGLDCGAVAVTVLGGDDVSAARAAYPYITPGISMFGNTRVEIIDGDSLCRTVTLLRPTEVEVSLTVGVARTERGILASEPVQIAPVNDDGIVSLIETRWAESRRNGLSPGFFTVRALIEGALQGVEIVSIEGTRGEESYGSNVDVPIGFSEIALVKVAGVTFNA